MHVRRPEQKSTGHDKRWCGEKGFVIGKVWNRFTEFNRPSYSLLRVVGLSGLAYPSGVGGVGSTLFFSVLHLIA